MDSKIEPVAWRTTFFENRSNGKLSRVIIDADEVATAHENWQPLYSAAALLAAEQRGRESERERCARIAEHLLQFADTTSEADKVISAAIRKGE